jgi:hypothetical protein
MVLASLAFELCPGSGFGVLIHGSKPALPRHIELALALNLYSCHAP